MKILIFLLAVTLFETSQGLIEPYDSNICRLFKNGVKLRNPGKCDSYITCQDGVAKITECKGKYFNKETGKCVTKVPDSYCKDPCTKKSPFWEKDPKSCEGYFTCRPEGGVQEYCPDDLDFDYKQQACVYKSDSNCKGFDICDIAPNNMPFKNENNCQRYYTCVKNKVTEKVCEKQYYDVQKGCTKKSEVECLNHPIPENACGTPKHPARDQFVSDELTCCKYYYCKDKGDNVVDESPQLGQCPEGKFFDSAQQACYTAENVRCDEDRCDGMNRSKVISSDEGCQHYLLCDKGVTVGKEKCPDGQYFDSSSMECTTTVQNYLACTS
ncbi:peritrophin-44-like [Episyrphus balteatus]|uniref:peritrophin-44-like n=1 Tax=Episyrphus balteatus TaxID=286459 RepID=UPI002486B0D8|nr:peritrophin-44-like [Episyrphus balteatus]